MTIITGALPEYLEIGKNDLHWYQDCQKMFEELFGEEELGLVCNLFAATSMKTTLEANIQLFRRAYWETKNNRPHLRYLPAQIQQLNLIRQGKELSGRKINAFAKAMSGTPEAVVVDIWLLRAFSCIAMNESRSATKKEYDAIENWCRSYALENGIEARQFSSMIWSGIQTKMTGKRNTRYEYLLRSKLENLFNII